MSKITLRWDIPYSSISSVVVLNGTVTVCNKGGAIYSFPEKYNESKVRKLKANISPKRITCDTDNAFEDIISSVTEIYSQDKSVVYLRTRKREVVQTRQICMALSKLKTKKSLTFVGRHYGNFDHATTIHSIKTVRNLLDTNKEFRGDVGHLFEGLLWPGYTKK